MKNSTFYMRVGVQDSSFVEMKICREQNPLFAQTHSKWKGNCGMWNAIMQL